MRGASSAARRRFAASVTALSLTLAALGYTSFAVLAPIAPVPAVTLSVDAVTTPPASVTVPGEGGAAIAAADGEQIYVSRDLDTPRALASITKVITALVVLEVYPIAEGASGASITLTAADSALPARYRAINGSIAPAPQGTVVTQRQVIELMMVRSANNYAETLALWAFGSIDDYLSAARAWLDDHDLEGITVGDSTGFSLQNAGTPRDLVELARIALDNEVVASAAALPSVTVDGVGTFETTNLALGLAGVTGIKTGTLDGIGANLLFSSSIAVDDATADVVGVVLGLVDQEAVATAVQTLITSASDDFAVVALGEPGTPVATYTAAWGDSAQLVVAESATVLVWGATSSRAVVEASPYVVGSNRPPDATLEFIIAGDRETVELEWVGEIGAPPIAWRLMQPIEHLLGR
jgi:D-alanyl-D-alanine carboxypeptidase (penicillin-binding protein 5/6)